MVGFNPQAFSAGLGQSQPSNPLIDLILGRKNPQQQNPDEDPLPVGVTQDTIVVSADQNKPNVDINGPDAPFMGNKTYLEEAAMSLEEAPKRSGMFGMKGTLRDVLGVVGDAFLVGTGNDRIYAPVREQEKMGDAMTGFTADDPQAVAAAAERLASMGYVNEAAALMEKAEAQRLAVQKAEAAQANSESLIGGRDWDRYSDVRDMAARIFGSTGRRNPELAMAQVATIAKRANVSLEDLGIRPDMTAEEMEVFASGDMTVNQQEALPRRDRQLAISQQNADTSRINATRPRAAPRPRSQTNLEYFQQIGRKPKSQRSKAEQDFYDKYVGNNSGKSSGSRRRSAPPPPPSGNSRFRIIRD